jgi:hypothetical protein
MQPLEEVVPFASGPPEQVSSCAHAAVTASDARPTGSADSADGDPVGDPALQPTVPVSASTKATAHNMPIPPKTPRVVNFIFPSRSGGET